jgi:[ribosomal protein S18]-alanine N-acetyltransferase
VSTQVIELSGGGTAELGLVDQLMKRAFDPRFGEAWTRPQCLGMLSLPGVWLTIARLNGSAAGFALARVIGDEAELLLLATLPQVRRLGVGGALLRSAMEEARSRGAKRLYLEVRSNNDAIGFYVRLGFHKVGQRRGYYRGPGGQLFDAFTLARDVD